MNMEYLNQTYEAVDSRPRPESYVNPCAIRDTSSCYINEENYETLTEVQTQFNIYEHLPNAGENTLQNTTNETNDIKLKKEGNTCIIEDKEMMKIKQDLRKTKVSVIILALFVVLLLVISLIAVALAVTIPQRVSTENLSETNGPQAVIAPEPENPSIQSTRKMVMDLSSELQELQDTVNATFRSLTSQQNELMELARQNISDVVSQLGALRNIFSSHSDQLHDLIQQITNHSNTTSLVNQVTILQDQSQQMQSKIMQAEGQIVHLMLTQSNLQMNVNVTQGNLTQLRHLISNVQNQLGTNQRGIEAVDDKVTAIRYQLTTTQTNLTSLYGEMNYAQQQLITTRMNVAHIRNQTSSLQTALNNHLSSSIDLYQNCHQNTTSCPVSNPTNNRRRLLCDTPALNANVTVSQ